MKLNTILLSAAITNSANVSSPQKHLEEMISPSSVSQNFVIEWGRTSNDAIRASEMKGGKIRRYGGTNNYEIELPAFRRGNSVTASAPYEKERGEEQLYALEVDYRRGEKTCQWRSIQPLKWNDIPIEALDKNSKIKMMRVNYAGKIGGKRNLRGADIYVADQTVKNVRFKVKGDY
ncbi:MAG TPA: hypothetical protein HA282_05665 [Nanoarchaeota archaeon]|nr:MAG: hypothetical protein QT01_C0001G0096 [archaeon GW2011_AR6]MBS3082572.1 hypothetical protein [Candidatus Pacearchaeota archaeon]HIH17467.1 hypothetical protein [Nanoarchaeota archaeon]HIH33950.1 hypothetical protein [Nanoarchaeota archaeon]HIH51759.1 hypothetical protein [Nanoarchaeota archaeon]